MLAKLISTASVLLLALTGCSSAGSATAKGAQRTTPVGSTSTATAAPRSTATTPAIPEASDRNAGGASTALDADSSAPGRSAGATSNGTGTNKDYTGPR